MVKKGIFTMSCGWLAAPALIPELEWLKADFVETKLVAVFLFIHRDSFSSVLKQVD